MQILCATDFLKPARDAADVAAALAKRLGLPLCLMHCGEDWIVMGELPVAEPDDALAHEQLASEAERLRATGIEVTTEFHRGNAGLEVASSAMEKATAMLVVGPVGQARPELLRTVPEQAAESVPVPTLIVRDARPLLAWLREEGTLNVLCGVDFTVSADAAIAAINDLRALGNVDVAAAYISPSLGQSETVDAKLDFQRDVWERLHAVLGDVPMQIHVRGAARHPADELLQLAGEKSTGLIVVGSHQHSGWHRLLKDSFSQAVIVHAETNVLCVPRATYTPEFHVPVIHRVLAATDFSDCGNAALRHAYSLVAPGGEVRLLHVCYWPSAGFDLAIAAEAYVDPKLATAKTREDAEAQLQAMTPRQLATSGITTSSEVRVHHDIGVAICEAADHYGADVICMGTKGHSRAHVALVGSTLQAVLARSHRSVFVVTPELG
ncbi:MAG: universal stress protein [Prosthecobacter sp.]|nr:universal stress protein [Prosthecobacter sp.]